MTYRVLDLFSGIGADQLRADYDGGMTQAEIAAKYGVTQKRVFTAMRRFGVKARVAAKRNQLGPAYSRHGKPTKCSVCETTESGHYDFANLSGRYEDIEDYAPMCRSCHWKYDKKHLNFTRSWEADHVQST